MLTGHTGFKGGWLSVWLSRLGAQVTGLALPAITAPNLFEAARVNSLVDHRCGDVRDAAAVAQIVASVRPEIVFHLAAQPLVRQSYATPLETFNTNVMGTANLLNALRHSPDLRVAVMVTTDKVYHNHEQIYPYRESDALGGHDPYSASKAASELVIDSYRSSFFQQREIAVASARAGNVIGGGDWSADRLFPDAIRAWQSGEVLQVRNPHATRPWQHVLEPLSGYLCLAEKLWEKPALAGSFNFGPEPHEASTVRFVLDVASSAFGSGAICYRSESSALHEAGKLTLEIAKAREVLGYCPRWGLRNSIERTVDWYQDFGADKDARDLCNADIDAFEATL